MMTLIRIIKLISDDTDDENTIFKSQYNNNSTNNDSNDKNSGKNTPPIFLEVSEEHNFQLSPSIPMIMMMMFT